MTQPLENQEPVNKDQGEETPQEEVKIHPAYQQILDTIPESLHPLVIPTLKEWDSGVQKKINDVRAEYEPYENLKKNSVPLDYIEQAMVLLDSVNDNPADVVAKMVEHFDLDYVQKAELEKLVTPDPEDDDEIVDLEKNPLIKELREQNKELMEWREQQVKTQAEADELEQYKKLMKDLHEEYGEFDDEGVTALLSSGLDGEKAVKRWNDIVNQAAAKNANLQDNVPTPPVVLGGNGASGSGVPAGDISFGSMKDGDIKKTVAELLAQSDKS